MTLMDAGTKDFSIVIETMVNLFDFISHDFNFFSLFNRVIITHCASDQAYPNILSLTKQLPFS